MQAVERKEALTASYFSHFCKKKKNVDIALDNTYNIFISLCT